LELYLAIKTKNDLVLEFKKKRVFFVLSWFSL